MTLEQFLSDLGFALDNRFLSSRPTCHAKIQGFTVRRPRDFPRGPADARMIFEFGFSRGWGRRSYFSDDQLRIESPSGDNLKAVLNWIPQAQAKMNTRVKAEEAKAAIHEAESQKRIAIQKEVARRIGPMSTNVFQAGQVRIQFDLSYEFNGATVAIFIPGTINEVEAKLKTIQALTGGKSS